MCLQELLPKAQVSTVHVVDFNSAEHVAPLRQQLVQSDVWLTIAGHDHFDLPTLNPGLKVMRIPQLWFGAFHPDLCYVRKVADNSPVKPDYNSAIGVWAFKHSLDPARAARLFNERVFHALGYFGEWQRSLTAMRNDFVRCGLEHEFDPFFLSIKRMGTFMHTLNHPKIAVLGELARAVAPRLGAGESAMRREINVADGLASWGYWPLYPELARYYALPAGGYVWRNTTGLFDGVEAYLQHQYSAYAKQGLGPSDITYLWKDAALYERVLSAAAEVTQ